MLVIRSKQMEAFQEMVGGNFEDQLVDHFQLMESERTSELAEEDLRNVIRYGMKRADNYSFTLRGPSRFYVEIMFMLGSDFDTDPQYPWVFDILSDPTKGDEVKRADALHGKLTEFSGTTASPEMIAHAMLATRKLFNDMPSEWGEDFEGAMLELARTIYPEKYDYVGEKQMKLLVEDSENTAANFDLGSESGVSLLFGLSFALGYCCAFDPLFPWIANSLEQSDPASRYRFLLEQSKTRLNRATAKL